MAEDNPLPIRTVTFHYLKSMLTTRAATYACKEVTPECPVEGTIYGYAPNYSTTVEFCVIFFICCLVQLAQMIRWRLWSFSISVILGALTEVIGTLISFPCVKVSNGTKDSPGKQAI
jgi:hypothetical protein